MRKNHAKLVLAAALLVSCSDSGFSTGLPANKGLGTLSPDEANQLCAATASYVASKAKMTTCQLEADAAAFTQAKTDADARMICKQQLDSCLAAPAAGGGGTDTGCKPPPASCTATVGDYESCLNDLSSAYDKALAGLPNCDTLTLALSGLPSSRPSLQSLASCNTLSSKCIGISVNVGSGSATPTKK
jgi:hypothetical protein